MEKDTKNWIIVILSIFVLLLVGAFIVKPATTGYAVYNEMSKTNASLSDYEKGLTSIKQEASDLKSNLSSCKELNKQVLDDIKEISGKYSICMEDLHDCNVSSKKEKEEIIEDYEEVIENVANRICCKEKIDNHKINYYIIDNEDIECIEDTEEGSKQIGCSF